MVTIADSRLQSLLHTTLRATSPQHTRRPSVTEPGRAIFLNTSRLSRGEDAVQSGLLWRNLCTDDTLADNYRVGGYSVDFNAGHGAHADNQSHLQQPYSSGQSSTFQGLHHYSFSSQNQQPRSTYPNSAGAVSTASGNTSPELPHGPSSSRSGLSEQSQPQPQPQPQQQQQQQQQQHPRAHPNASNMQLDTSHMNGSRLGHVPYGSAASVTAPMYPPTASPSQGHASFLPNSAKRIRNDEFEISMTSVSALGQPSLEAMAPSSIGAAYGQAAAAAAAASNVDTLPHPTQGQHLQHHHHHLPDLGHLGKFTRREEGSGAPSMVGQAGMPAPAPRPRGPKLKFTAEDDQLLIELKEQKNLTWKQIADFFPGRSSGTLQVRYCTKLKAKTTQWTDEMDHKLRTALADYEAEKWRIIAHKVGNGFTPAACRERTMQMMGEEDPDTTWQSLSPRSTSGQEESETIELPQIHRPWRD
ncbi:hypothetical protein E4U42_002857 [Claviceps africana]|uniref:MYB DNA-binding domain-containing protein n=1 Tax=Claviceps africana TaxID=83212 RepID=A0A8K0NLV5_9HYPO|nr:hypothetical protein E4U42_002857 [Claviceps africana]